MSDPKSPLPPWGSALAGASGAVIANALVYPLDLVKTRLQVQVKGRTLNIQQQDPPQYASTWDGIAKIIAEEGLPGLYTGIGGSLLGVTSTNFAYFYCYALVRSLHVAVFKRDTPPNIVSELALGAVAGATAQVFTIPISVITTRQQTQARHVKRSLAGTAEDIIRSSDGWRGLWRGLKASLILVINPSITYGAYQRLRVLLIPNKKVLRPWESFMLGAGSKALATIATQPLIVAKVLRYIANQEGLGALYKGIGPQILKGVLVQGLLMMIKERVEILFIVLFAYIRRLRISNSRVTAMEPILRAKKILPLVIS